ncbi:hypothetical protein EG328_003331 [Venturia inaequalis]|uniref:Major facilitator superfamily (MFS) profile domain-containing protein n=1 Tax=Venturia inaequalis TaxID=5025 RepID=A0A8H3VLH2_VENIN|nr:hypothetical protein EG328_003331 [Venturia inaequalis]
MGHPNASKVGLITAILFVGGVVGAIAAPPVTDKWGRRMGLLVGCLFTLAGAIIQTCAQGSAVFIVGRLLIGVGISFTLCAGPSLLNELAHPRMRGKIGASFNLLWYVGSIVAAWTTFGTGHIPTSWSWRIPSLMQGIPSVLVIAALPFIPESPRWLHAHGRETEAKRILYKYHANGVTSDPLIDAEFEEIAAGVRMDAQRKSETWTHLLRSKANRKSFAICIVVPMLTLWNGQGVIAYYFSPILKSIGISSTNQITGINGGLQIWNLICSVIGVLLAERMGRRKLWLTSFFGMILANVPFTIASAMYTKNGSDAAAKAVVVFLFLYDAAFNIGCNPLPYCYTIEVLPFGIRSKGMGLTIAVGEIALAVNQYVNPVALDSIGYFYYIFYLGMLVIWILVIHFFFPETKGFSLEELSMIFEDEKMVGIVGVEMGEEIEGVEFEMGKEGVRASIEKL